MRASLAILAALGVALALAGLGDGRAASRADAAARADGATAARGSAAGEHGARLEPNVALRVSAPDPSTTLPVMLDRFATASEAPAVRRAVARTSEALAGARVDPGRDLLARFSFLVISLERSCPPPALLACRPAVRVLARLRGEPPPRLRRDLRVAVVAALRAAGFRALTVSVAPSRTLAGRVVSREETLSRWRLAGGVLEVATGGLGLSEDPPLVTRRAAAASAAAGERVRVEADPATLALLLGD